MRRVLMVAAVGLALLLVWLLAGRDGPGPDDTGPRPGESASAPERALPSAGVEGGRTPAPGPDPAADAQRSEEFTSTPEDEEPVARPVRDGVVVVLVDPDGRAVAEHPLGVYWRKGFGRYGWDRGRTDAQGRLPTTVAEVALIEDLEVVDPARGVELDAAAPPDPRDAVDGTVFVRLPAWRDVVLRVVDLGGRAVAGTALGIERARSFPREPGTCVLGVRESAATTGPDGVARLALPEGIFEVEVRDDRLRSMATWRLIVEPGTGAIEAVLRAAGPADGRVVRVRVVMPAGIVGEPDVTITNSGLPAAVVGEGSLALVVIPERRGRGGERADDGAFVVRGVEPLDATLYVSCEGCERLAQPLPAGATEAVAALRAAQPDPLPPTVRGVVVDGTGAPLSLAKVGLCRDDRIAHARFVNTAGEGRFEIERPVRGAFVLTARATGYAFTAAGPFDAARDPSPVRIAMEPEREITGRVLDPTGRPVADLNLWLYRARGPFAVFAPDAAGDFLSESSTDDMGVIGEDGSFRFDELGPGRYEIRAVPYEGSRYGIGRAIASAGQSVDVVLGEGFPAGATLVGRVLDARTGAGVSGALVKVRAVPGGGSIGSGEARGDREGRFRCVGVTPGAVQIEVEAPGYAFLELPPRELAAGENEAELRVPEALRLSLRLIDVRGTPVGGVGVGVDDGRGGLLSLQDALGRYDGAVATTDVAGRVDVFGVPRARVRIVVGAIGSGWRSEPPLRGTISPGVHAFELDLRTPPTGIVTLTVP